MPAAVGVDIGCGMIAVRTQHRAGDLPGDRRIKRAVPLSAGARNDAVSRDHTRDRLAALRREAEDAGFDPARYAKHWELQLGTLGSGNTP